jgi:hypothetical protein
VDWPEPFGLVMIEALACGTPVIARPCGSVPEVLRHGISGFIESSIDDLADAVHKVHEIPRRTCRDEFERRFTAEVMADNYEQVYYQLADMYRKAQGTAVRPKRTIHDVALAREAARQWHRLPEGDGLKARPKSEAPVLKLFSGRDERDPTNLDS